MRYKEDTKRMNERTQNSVKCKCGHSVVFKVQTDRIICDWCGRFVYRKPSLEFMYRLAIAERKLK